MLFTSPIVCGARICLNSGRELFFRELRERELAIGRTRQEELGMRSARFDGSCLVQQDDLIGTKRHVHSLRYGEHALSFKVILDSCAHACISLEVERREGIVEDVEISLAQKTTRNSDTLTLTT